MDDRSGAPDQGPQGDAQGTSSTSALSPSAVEEFCAAFGVWAEARPYLPLVVDEAEMRLVLTLRSGPATAGETAARLGLSEEAAAALLWRAYSRCIVDKVKQEGPVAYTAGSFYGRLDHFAKYENWDDIPLVDRRAIDRRFLDEFIARHRPAVERKMQGAEAGGTPPNDTILLLPEAKEMLDAAELIVLQPCDCRRLGQYCDRPVGTCLSLDSVAREILDRGHGREISRDEAKKLVRWADRQGLMHTSGGNWRTDGLHAICNCCACDCYPFRAAQELGSKGVWPRSRWVADFHIEPCVMCGLCVRRCQFEAFYHDGTTVLVAGKEKPSVRFDAGRCWGCGLCANACPAGAITMVRLDQSDLPPQAQEG